MRPIQHRIDDSKKHWLKSILTKETELIPHRKRWKHEQRTEFLYLNNETESVLNRPRAVRFFLDLYQKIASAKKDTDPKSAQRNLHAFRRSTGLMNGEEDEEDQHWALLRKGTHLVHHMSKMQTLEMQFIHALLNAAAFGHWCNRIDKLISNWWLNTSKTRNESFFCLFLAFFSFFVLF